MATTPGKAIVIRNQRRQRWENTHLNNVICERNKEIANQRAHIKELEVVLDAASIHTMDHENCGCSLCLALNRYRSR